MKLKIDYVGNATHTLHIDEAIKIGLDPTLAPKGSSLGFGIIRLIDPQLNAGVFENVDLWLITHPHLDHIDDQGLAYIKKEASVVASSNSKKILNKAGIQAQYLSHHETYTFEKSGYKIKITAIPAYHGHGGFVIKLMGIVNGYYLEIQKDNEVKTVYIPSDTVYHQKLLEHLKTHNIQNVDLLIANLGAAKAPLPVTRYPITMDLAELQKLAQTVSAKHVLPIHIDDYSHFRTTKEEVSKVYEVLHSGDSKEWLV